MKRACMIAIGGTVLFWATMCFADPSSVRITETGVSHAGDTMTGTLVVPTVTATNLGGTLSAAAQPNVTSLGTLTGLTTSGNIQVSAPWAWIFEPNQTTADSLAIMAGNATGATKAGGNLYLQGGLAAWTLTVTNYANSATGHVEVRTQAGAASATVMTDLVEGTDFVCYGTSNNTCAGNIAAAVTAGVPNVSASALSAVVSFVPTAAMVTSIEVTTVNGAGGVFCTIPINVMDGSVVINAGARIEGDEGDDALKIVDRSPGYGYVARTMVGFPRVGGEYIKDWLAVGLPGSTGVAFWQPAYGAMLAIGNDLTSLGTSLAIMNSSTQSDFIEINGWNATGWAGATRKFTFADTDIGSNFTGPGLLVFGDKVVGAPALKNDSGVLAVRTGTDAADMPMRALSISLNGLGTISSAADGLFLISNAGGTSNNYIETSGNELAFRTSSGGATANIYASYGTFSGGVSAGADNTISFVGRAAFQSPDSNTLNIKLGPKGEMVDVVVKSQELTCSSSATLTTTTALIPRYAHLLGVTTRISVALTGSGLSGYTVGDGSTANRYGTSNAVTLGTTTGNPGAEPAHTAFAAAEAATITFTGGTCTSGKVRVDSHYMMPEAATTN